MSYTKRQTTDPTEAKLGELEEYQIHHRYRPFILGLLREIEFMTNGELATHNCLGRAVYLQEVMDEFTEELKAAFMAVPERWRLQVLNPLLQHQLRGVSDHESFQEYLMTDLPPSKDDIELDMPGNRLC